MFIVVYKITNLLNEKIYIGQTKQPIERRFLQHSKANYPLGQAMRECGLENFTIEIIERCENQNELNEREKFWIKVLKSKSPNGYNLSSGCNGFCEKNKMATNKRVFTMRMQPENFNKIRVIAAINKRSVAMQIEYLIENCIAN